MKLSPLGILVMLAAAILAVSCAPTREQRIAANATYFSSLAPDDQAAVKAGGLRVGMPREAVLLSLGKPDRILESVRQDGKSGESWTYLGYRVAYQYPGWPAYPVRDRCGRVLYFNDPGPDVIHIPYVATRVFFHQGTVSGWEKDQSPR